jgi:hypothetical protein
VAEGRELVPGSTSVEIGDRTVVDGRIEFPVTASATQVRPLDAAALEQTVLGLPIGRQRRPCSRTATSSSTPGRAG